MDEKMSEIFETMLEQCSVLSKQILKKADRMLTTTNSYDVYYDEEKTEDSMTTFDDFNERVVNFADDANSAIAEIKKFKSFDVLNSDDEKLEEKINECPFLLSIWFGDTYPSLQKTDAFRKLISELYLTINNMDDFISRYLDGESDDELEIF